MGKLESRGPLALTTAIPSVADSSHVLGLTCQKKERLVNETCVVGALFYLMGSGGGNATISGNYFTV